MYINWAFLLHVHVAVVPCRGYACADCQVPWSSCRRSSMDVTSSDSSRLLVFVRRSREMESEGRTHYKLERTLRDPYCCKCFLLPCTPSLPRPVSSLPPPPRELNSPEIQATRNINFVTQIGQSFLVFLYRFQYGPQMGWYAHAVRKIAPTKAIATMTPKIIQFRFNLAAAASCLASCSLSYLFSLFMSIASITSI